MVGIRRDRGVALGSVAMPPDLRVIAVDEDFVIGVFLDEFDVENIRLHRINKDTGS